MSEPIITFNNRTLRVEDDGWHLEVKVLASGRQISVKSAGTADGNHELIIRPNDMNHVLISSRASEKETTQNAENSNPTTARATTNDGSRRPAKR